MTRDLSLTVLVLLALTGCPEKEGVEAQKAPVTEKAGAKPAEVISPAAPAQAEPKAVESAPGAENTESKPADKPAEPAAK